VDLILNGISMKDMVDSSASHNLLRKELASEIELRIVPCDASFKSVKSKEKEVVGVAIEVHVQSNKWKGHANFTAIHLDDFEVTLGK
jgi:hypothetical protein